MTTVISHSIAGTGIYKTPIGFANDANAAFPYRWTNQSTATSTTTVIASAGTHNKVLELYDATNLTRAQCYFTLSADVVSGTIEWYWSISAINKFNCIWLKDSAAAEMLYLENQTGTSVYRCLSSGAVWTTLINPIVAAQWYHFRVDYVVATHKCNVYVDGVLKADNVDFTNNGALGFYKFHTDTANTPNAFYVYFDAIGVTGVNGYAIGDNLNAYTSVVYKRALARRGTHESHHDFSAFDITKMSFPQQI